MHNTLTLLSTQLGRTSSTTVLSDYMIFATDF